jgi:glycosyltransferase involved in cell wall biosynthesis
MAIGRVDTALDLAVFERSVSGSASPGLGVPGSARVALVHLGNPGALGTTRRVAVWRDLLAAAEHDVVEVNLLRDHRRLVPSPLAALPSLRGRVVPETATWSWRAAERAIRALDPDVVLFVTPRAFHPRLAEVARHSILDFQDRFSHSYRGRAAVDRRPGATTAWTVLSWALARFERRDHRVQTVTAGWSESLSIGATWIPNVVDVMAPETITDHADAPFDALFFGKLSALPNVDAIRELAGIWPSLDAEVPGISCLVAGNNPSDEVLELARTHGWNAEGDFDDVAGLCQRARLAVAPLRHANGIQNKVLEAAAAGIPQVVSPEALGGTAPGFPAMVVHTPGGTIGAIRLLLQNPERRIRLALEAHAHVAAHYSVERWAPVVHDLIMN